MNKEQKRKLALIAVLGAALLVGGTFAFQAFNQQAINDRLRDNEVEVGGRVHDYYNRETENKDVFVHVSACQSLWKSKNEGNPASHLS